MGVLVTLLFIPEVACLDLSEGDKRWEALKAGKPCCMVTRNHRSQCLTHHVSPLCKISVYQ